MDHSIARRRVSKILGHVTCVDSELSPNPHLLPLNCSGTLNFMGPRCDNTLLFARQGSASQACFMQQVSVKPYSGEPLFSRQTQARCTLPALKDEPFAKQDSTPTSTEAPKFARQYSEKSEKSQLCCNRTSQVPLSKGMEWSPRIDVAESRADYVVTVELPGVSILDIRVEVDDQKLIVTGKRSTQKSSVANSSENSDLKYHRREIMQGRYRVFWPLPNNVNKDGVSAEFVNGFLRITLPKF